MVSTEDKSAFNHEVSHSKDKNNDTDTDDEGRMIRKAKETFNSIMEPGSLVVLDKASEKPGYVNFRLVKDGVASDPDNPVVVTACQSHIGVNRGGSRAPKATPRRPAGAVTLRILIEAGLINPGPNVLMVEYKNSTTFGDLTPDGLIICNGQRYESPSAFSIFVKRQLNPGRKADDGWKAVRYAGKLLEHYKEMFQKYQYEKLISEELIAEFDDSPPGSPSNHPGHERPSGGEDVNNPSHSDGHDAGAICHNNYNNEGSSGRSGSSGGFRGPGTPAHEKPMPNRFSGGGGGGGGGKRPSEEEGDAGGKVARGDRARGEEGPSLTKRPRSEEGLGSGPQSLSHAPGATSNPAPPPPPPRSAAAAGSPATAVSSTHTRPAAPPVSLPSTSSLNHSLPSSGNLDPSRLKLKIRSNTPTGSSSGMVGGWSQHTLTPGGREGRMTNEDEEEENSEGDMEERN